MTAFKHVTVYASASTFAGWPANHGHWQWGDEFLCGFMTGKYDDYGNGMHKILHPYKKLLARSFDGGEHWRVEIPNAAFNGEDPRPGPSLNLFNPDTIIRACGNYDTGGETCHQRGAFYLSTNRGLKWKGPFDFGVPVEDIEHGTMRTCVLRTSIISGGTEVEFERVYLSYADRKRWGSDYIVEAIADGNVFRVINTVVSDNHRAVMPAVAHLKGMNRIVLVCRRKGNGKNWIDAFGCDGPSYSVWKQLSAEPIADTGWHNGNPPALAAIDDTLYCAYGNRSSKQIEMIQSFDGGMVWGPPIVLDKSVNLDLGYPRLFTRSDGQLVCVYYIANSENEPNQIRACIFNPKGVTHETRQGNGQPLG